MNHTDKTDAIWAAFETARNEMDRPRKDGTNPDFKSRFATLGSVLLAIEEPLQKNGLVLSHEISTTDSVDVLYTHLHHPKSGQQLTFGPARLVMKDSTDPQKMGGSITYLRRYTITSIFMLVEDDDDGNQAAKPKSKPKPKTKQEPKDEHTPADVGKEREREPGEDDDEPLSMSGRVDYIGKVKKGSNGQDVCTIKLDSAKNKCTYDVGIWGKTNAEKAAANIKKGQQITVEYHEQKQWEDGERGGIQLTNARITEPDMDNLDIPF